VARVIKKYIGWSDAVLQQLDVSHCSYFPAILTYKCVVSLKLLITLCTLQ